MEHHVSRYASRLLSLILCLCVLLAPALVPAQVLVTPPSTLPPTSGGTGLTSYAIGDLLYADTTTSLAKLADVAVGSVLVSGGVGAPPAYSATPTLTSLTLNGDFSFGGNAVRSATMQRHTTANTAGNALTLQAGGATSGATNKAGGQLNLVSGLSTGSGVSAVQVQVYGITAASTTDDSALRTQQSQAWSESGTDRAGTLFDGMVLFNNQLIAYPTDTSIAAAPRIYGTGNTGGAYPFTTAGHLVIQGRPSDSTDIVFATGATPSAKMAIKANGTLLFPGTSSGTVTVATPAAAGSGTLTWPTRTGTIGSTTGTLTTGQQLAFDSTGNVIASGTAIGGTGAGGGLIVYSALSASLTGTRYLPVGGGGPSSATEVDVDADLNLSATISNLGISVSQAFGAGNSAAYTWRKNAADTSLTCTISGASATTCVDSTHSFSISPGDLVSIKVVYTGTIVVTPQFQITTQVGTTNSNGTVNSGTSGNMAYYGATGTAISDAGVSLAALSTRVCNLVIGGENGSALADADLGPQGQQCKITHASTLVEIGVNADAGTPSVIVRKKHCASFTAGVCTSWTSTDVLSSALAAAASNFDACAKTTAVTGLDGGTTCAATLQNTALSAGDWLELKSGTAGGTAKRVSVNIVRSVP